MAYDALQMVIRRCGFPLVLVVDSKWPCTQWEERTNIRARPKGKRTAHWWALRH